MWTPYIKVVTTDGEGNNVSPGEALGSIDINLRELLLLQINALQDLAGQIRLLNARFEEAFDTGIDENDTQ